MNSPAVGPLASRWAPLVLLFAVGALVYGRSLANGFVLDDETQILGNDSVHALSSIGSYFGGSTMDTGGAGMNGIYYKPVMTLSYALLWTTFGPSGLAFHGFQLIVHILVGYLAMLVFRTFFSAEVALVLALVFLVHPINTECVVYAADLQDALYMFFGLAALRLCCREGSFDWRHGLAVGGCLLLAMLSKETGVLFVVLCAAYLRLFKRERWQAFLVSALAAGALYAVLRFAVADLHALKADTAAIARASFGVRLLTVPKVVWHYVGTFIFPLHLTITEDWVVARPGLLDFWLPLTALSAGLGALVWYGRRFARADFLFFSLWALLGFGLHSQLVPLDGTVADRWFYFTQLGALGLGALIVRDVASRARARSEPAGGAPLRTPWLWAPVVLLLLALGARSFARSLDWRDGLTLYAHDLQLQPDSFVLLNDYGVELVRSDRVAESEPYFRRSTIAAPYWNVNWSNLGTVQESLGQRNDAELSFRRSIANGAYSLAYEGYARLLANTGRLEEARQFLKDQALPQFPQNRTLAELYATIGDRGR